MTDIHTPQSHVDCHAKLPRVQRGGVTVIYAGTGNPEKGCGFNPEVAPPGTPDLGWEDNDVTLYTTFSERWMIIDYGTHPHRFSVTSDTGQMTEETTLVAETLVECLRHLRDICCNYCGETDVIVNDGVCAECHAELDD
jgi:hypothetical protein